ncbi:rhomboid family intramembrane serine protease [Nonomuraea bangladeshensis]|uniref:rhomboid family intramembrane serine protease n=1 Tax=Nonomuraea bangladeshensis TaxID=404385 RepID=UPI003C2D6197
MGDYSGSRFDSVKRGAGSLLSGAFSAFLIVAAMLAIMWIVEVVDVFLNGALDQNLALRGGDPDRLFGILFTPFLHAGFGHLVANSLPLLVLGFFAGLRDLSKFFWATLIIIVVGGFGTWLISPKILTVGASGLVFGYFGYIMARGLFDRRLLDLVIAVGVGIAYWGILAGLLPNQPGISWQGHLCGLIAGVLAGWLLRRRSKKEVPAY